MSTSEKSITYETSIDELNLSNRAINRLKRHGVNIAGELVLLSDEEIMSMPSTGKKTVEEILAVINMISAHFARNGITGTIEKKETPPPVPKTSFEDKIRFVMKALTE